MKKTGKKMKICGSILAADYTRLGDEIREAEKAGVDGLHLDVMDGHFVRDIAFGFGFARAIRKLTNLELNVHLMVAQPEQYLAQYASESIDLIFVHVETCKDMEHAIRTVRSYGCKIGVALNFDTDVSAIAPVLDQVDAILVISVVTGIGGQDFNKEAVRKIRHIRQMDTCRDSIEIYVDGGVNAGNMSCISDAGATCAIVGTALFGTDHSYHAALRTLREAVG